MTNYSQYFVGSRQRGFTLFELVVAVAVISVLAVVALNYYYKLLVDVERTAMEQDLGGMRSLISMQVAGYFAAGNMAELEKLVGSNPIDMLPEKPKNYLGVISHYRLDEVEKGSWFYDSRSQVLIYLVRNQLYFETSLNSPARARFKLKPVYSTAGTGRGKTKYISGLILEELEPYRWLRPWG